MSERTKRIALATSRELRGLWPGDRLLLAELRRRGLEANPAVWDEDRPWLAEYDAMVIRSCWDYHLKADRFAEWIDALERAAIPTLNPPHVLRWNMHKRYLLEAEAAALRIPPTRLIAGGTAGTLRDQMHAAGWSAMVMKPAISSGERAYEAAVAAGDVLLQAYVPDVRERGEWSCVFFGGVYSHAVLKRAAPGEFRVHIEWGGSVRGGEPPSELREAAERAVGRLAAGTAYARVDMTETADGPVLMELELIEPELFLDHHPLAPSRLADAVLSALRHAW